MPERPVRTTYSGRQPCSRSAPADAPLHRKRATVALPDHKSPNVTRSLVKPHESLRVQVRRRSPRWQIDAREEDRSHRATSRSVPTPNRVRERAISSNSSTTLPSPPSLLRSARQVSFGPSGAEPDLARRAASTHEAAQLSSQIFDRPHLIGPNDQDTPSLISQ